jgi:prenyltransferase beta subunit
VSIRLEMLQVARLAPKLLAESTELVRRFLFGQQNDDGGFKDRSGRSDLYYTVFGLEGLLALQAPLPIERVVSYLRPFGGGAELDLVHLCCLARAWAAFGAVSSLTMPPADREQALKQIECFRSRDGGYHPVAGRAGGTVYAGFLAIGAHQDLRSPLPDPESLAQALMACATPDGAWANEPGMKEGSTNATAAAVTLLRQLSHAANKQVGDWLLARVHPQGGFRAAPAAPVPDLLSTATALHALAGLERDCSGIKESCVDFVDSLWTNEGAFHGHWGDDALDCEYTYYGLLALGHLSL